MCFLYNSEDSFVNLTLYLIKSVQIEVCNQPYVNSVALCYSICKGGIPYEWLVWCLCLSCGMMK